MMKKQYLLFLGLLIFSALTTFSSCTEDGIIDPGPSNQSPSIQLMSATGFISSSAFVTVGETMQFRVNASAGDDDLSLFTITESGKNVELDRITFPSGNPFASNPAQVLVAGDKLGFTHDFAIEAPLTPGNYEYSFEVKDAGNKTAKTAVSVTVDATAPALGLVDTPSSFEAGPGSLAKVKIDVVKGTFDLATIAVYENNVLMDASQVYFDDGGLQAFSSNPVATPSTDSFQATLAIQIADSGETASYGIDVADTQGLVGSVDINVSIGVSIDTSYTGVLSNWTNLNMYYLSHQKDGTKGENHQFDIN